MSDLKRITVYTDGACIGNPGPGGYGIVLLYGEHRKELSGGDNGLGLRWVKDADLLRLCRP